MLEARGGGPGFVVLGRRDEAEACEEVGMSKRLKRPHREKKHRPGETEDKRKGERQVKRRRGNKRTRVEEEGLSTRNEKEKGLKQSTSASR